MDLQLGSSKPDDHHAQQPAYISLAAGWDQIWVKRLRCWWIMVTGDSYELNKSRVTIPVRQY
jgi:hypothetical protein